MRRSSHWSGIILRQTMKASSIINDSMVVGAQALPPFPEVRCSLFGGEVDLSEVNARSLKGPLTSKVRRVASSGADLAAFRVTAAPGGDAVGRVLLDPGGEVLRGHDHAAEEAGPAEVGEAALLAGIGRDDHAGDKDQLEHAAP